MKIHGLAFCLLFLIAALPAAWAQPLMPSTRPISIDLSLGNTWEYRGNIGENLPIGLTLRFSKDGTSATGCYFYYKYCKDIRIEATIDGRAVVIREFDPDNKMTGRFVGEFVTTDPHNHFSTNKDLQGEVIVGTWSKPDGSKPRPFYLVYDHIGSWSDETSRYANAGFDDQQVADRFMARFRQAVLDEDVDKAASMVSYPIDVSIDGKRQTIPNAGSFRKNYDKIFLPGYVDRIRQSPPCHMFSRDQGVMLGSGEVWIAPVKKRADDHYVTAVVDINNDIGTAKK